MRRALAILLGLVVVIASRSARAQRTPARLVYERAPELEAVCPDRGGLVDLVAGRLGYDPFDDGAARALDVTIARQGTLVRGTLALVDAEGHRGRERVFTESEGACGELASTLALTASILLDPTSLTGAPKAAVVTPARTAELPSPTPEHLDVPPDEPPPPSPPPPPPPRLAGRVGAALLGTAFAEPGPSLGFAVLGGVQLERVSVDVEGRADLPRSVTRDGLRAMTSLVLVTLAPCVRFGAALACALGSMGALEGSVEANGTEQSRSSFYAAAGVRLGAELPLGHHVSLRLHGDALATLTRTSLDATTTAERANATHLWSTPPLSVALGLGAAYLFR